MAVRRDAPAPTMPKHPDMKLRTFAIEAVEAGFSWKEIQEYTKMSSSALSRLFQRVKKSESGKSSLDPTSRKPGSGRRWLMTEELRREIRKVMEEEDDDEREVSVLYIWEKLPSLNGMCLRSVQQVVTDVRREREETAKTKKKKDSNNNG